MLKIVATAALVAAIASSAQPVLSGMGRAPAEYSAVWGKPSRTGDGPFQSTEQIWTVKRKNGWSSQEFEVHVLFRNARSMEERWIRPGSANWEKDELWTVLDGKGGSFNLLRQGTQLVSPYQVLIAPNTLINFTTSKGDMVAQLQNSIQGPQLRISSREWAQTKSDMGVSGGGEFGGRLASGISQGRVRPQWGGKSIPVLTANLKELPPKPNVRQWNTRTSRSTLTWTTRKNAQLDLVLNEAVASQESNRVLQAAAPNPDALKEALREALRKFYAAANLAVPGLIGGAEWDPDRIDGIFGDEVLQDLLAIKRMPSEFSLLSWRDKTGESWNLSLLPTGYRLTISWPAGMEPK
jgi:hypothetical protein